MAFFLNLNVFSDLICASARIHTYYRCFQQIDLGIILFVVVLALWALKCQIRVSTFYHKNYWYCRRVLLERFEFERNSNQSTHICIQENTFCKMATISYRSHYVSNRWWQMRFSWSCPINCSHEIKYIVGILRISKNKFVVGASPCRTQWHHPGFKQLLKPCGINEMAVMLRTFCKTSQRGADNRRPSYVTATYLKCYILFISCNIVVFLSNYIVALISCL